MNKVITIGREFGSGGRELAKRLSELLGYAYYDKEIVSEIAKRTSLAENYVKQVIEHSPRLYFPSTTGRTLHAHTIGSDYMIHHHATIYAEQANVLREMADTSDCIIVGRCADYILRDREPLRLFVYADMDAKVARCRARDPEEELSDKALRKKIKRVDRNRAKYYQYYTGKKWGACRNYDLCVNTSSASVEALARMLADLIRGSAAEEARTK